MDRLAFSAVWTVDAETAEVIDVRFHKSVIRSVAAMSYGAAQAIIEMVQIQDKIETEKLCKDDVLKLITPRRHTRRC